MNPPPPISRASAALTLPCKCCGATATQFGVVDFSRGCLDPRLPPDPPVTLPVQYHRCTQCGFLFTAAFDEFTPEDFRRFIYNDEYARFDPDYRDARPRHNAQFVAGLFGGSPDLRILDYGGGSGLLASLLGKAGFSNVETYDPFVPAHDRLPTGKYDLVLSFEVVEHSTSPREVFADLMNFVSEDGIVLFTTAFQPADIAQLGTSWWYIGPRNGHVSLHTPQSVTSIVKPMGFRFASSPDGMVHLLFRSVPAFARHLNLATKGAAEKPKP